mmetsp:Transcript_72378/g.205899  ORF Transcript_72378/g.205899 Transcript_72378/m.205899 type:complete len:85 (-) Transcript_72378:126-380(-)
MATASLHYGIREYPTMQIFTTPHSATQTFTHPLAHLPTHTRFWSCLCRIVIFLLWILLGLPHVTETNLAETNIVVSEEHVAVNV